MRIELEGPSRRQTAGSSLIAAGLMLVFLVAIGCTYSLFPDPSDQDIVTTARSKLFARAMCHEKNDVKWYLTYCNEPRNGELGPEDFRDHLEACLSWDTAEWDSADDWRAPRDWLSPPWYNTRIIAERVPIEPYPTADGLTFGSLSPLALSIGQPATAAHFRNVAREILHHGGTCEGPIDADGVPLRCRFRLETVLQYRWDDWKAPMLAATLEDLTVVFPGPPVGDSVASITGNGPMSLRTRGLLTHLSRDPDATLILADLQHALLDPAEFEAYRSRILASGGVDCRATDVPDFAAAGAE